MIQIEQPSNGLEARWESYTEIYSPYLLFYHKKKTREEEKKKKEEEEEGAAACSLKPISHL